MQRTLIIGLGALVLIGIGTYAYFQFFRGPSVTVAPLGSTSLPVAGQAPFGSSGQTDGTVPTVPSPGTPVTVTNRLVQIDVGPVVPGAVVTTTKVAVPNLSVGTSTKVATTSSSFVTGVNYIERQSGNVFTYRADTKIVTRVSNKTVPSIQSAAWFPSGSAALVRYLSGADFSTINTYALPASTTQGFFLPQNLADVSVSSTSILTLTSGVNGSIASKANADGSRSSTVFTTPLTSLRVSFAGKNQYLAFTKPTGTLPGTAFLVNGAGTFSRIAGPKNGLAALASPSGKWLLVSYTEDTAMRMQLVNTTTGGALELPVATIVDKCVWASDDSSVYCGVPVNPPQAVYPDDWYQGVAHFQDRIWEIHVTNSYAQMILDFTSVAQKDLDAYALSVDSRKTMLVFSNKNDDSLWGYTL